MLLKKIVVAEDDDAIAHMVNMALGDAGFLCLRAVDGEEALRLVRMHQPDLLVLDVMMPRLDGIEVTKRLKADVIHSRTPILMLTALGSVDSKVEGLEAGADDYMVKPFDLREFGARVRALVRSAKRERERNPTTDLPGSGAIDGHIEQLLAEGTAAAVLHFDVRHFDRYADEVGFARAESLVVTLGRIVLDKTRQRSAGSAFVGHLGGADFMSVIAIDQAEPLANEVIEAFEASRTTWTEPAASVSASMAMTVAVVSTEDVEAGALQTLAQRLAAAMRQAKGNDGSSYVVWRPH